MHYVMGFLQHEGISGISDASSHVFPDSDRRSRASRSRLRRRSSTPERDGPDGAKTAGLRFSRPRDLAKARPRVVETVGEPTGAVND